MEETLKQDEREEASMTVSRMGISQMYTQDRRKYVPSRHGFINLELTFYFQRGVNFTDVVDLEQEFVYESYTPGQRTSHSKETCRFCGDSDGSMDEDDSLGESSGSSSHSGAVVPPEAVELFREAGLDSEPDYNDDEDDDNDSVYFMDQECTGLQDIVFTGTVRFNPCVLRHPTELIPRFRIFYFRRKNDMGTLGDITTITAACVLGMV